MVYFYEWGSTASRLEMHCEEAVYYLQLSSLKFLVLAVSGVSGHNNLTIVLLQVIHLISTNEILEKIGKKCSPNGNHYIFITDLTRLTKMFSLSRIYLNILNMYAKIASYSPFSLYFFFP